MVEHPHVTVVLATRNRSSYLDAALTSLVAQDYDSAFEILVVDNGSTDDTPVLLDRWRRADERVHIVCEPRPGLSNAKNAGVAAARGEILAFTDDDVVADPRWLATLVAALDSHPAELDVVGGKIVPVPKDLEAWPAWFDDVALPEAGMLELADGESVTAPQYVWGASMAVRSELFRRLGSWNHALGRRGDERGTFEDTELQDRARAAGGTVWFCRDAVLQHRVPRSSLTRRELALKAFARGGYDRRIEQLRGADSSNSSVALAVASVSVSLANLVVWEVMLRLAPVRRVFRRLHDAAWRMGYRLEVLESYARRHPGAPSERLARTFRRVTWISRRLIKDSD
jgi:glycosyltransferase involved in cell wall biosynthesis